MEKNATKSLRIETTPEKPSNRKHQYTKSSFQIPQISDLLDTNSMKNKDSKYINFINHYSLDGHKLRKSEPSTPNKKQKSGIVSHFQKKSAQVKTKSRIGIDDIKSSAKSLFSDSETHSFRENDIMNLKSKVLRLEATIKDKDEALRTLNIEYSRMFEFKQNKNISEDK